jgi:hypothetical protein
MDDLLVSDVELLKDKAAAQIWDLETLSALELAVRQMHVTWMVNSRGHRTPQISLNGCRRCPWGRLIEKIRNAKDGKNAIKIRKGVSGTWVQEA